LPRSLPPALERPRELRGVVAGVFIGESRGEGDRGDGGSLRFGTVLGRDDALDPASLPSLEKRARLCWLRGTGGGGAFGDRGLLFLDTVRAVAISSRISITLLRGLSCGCALDRPSTAAK